MESIAYYVWTKVGAPEELSGAVRMIAFTFFGDGCYDATVGANGKVYLLQVPPGPLFYQCLRHWISTSR